MVKEIAKEQALEILELVRDGWSFRVALSKVLGTASQSVSDKYRERYPVEFKEITEVRRVANINRRRAFLI